MLPWREAFDGNEVPDGCKGGVPCIVGIDEAGRGPVLGPLVYGAAYWPAADDTEISRIGFDGARPPASAHRRIAHAKTDWPHMPPRFKGAGPGAARQDVPPAQGQRPRRIRPPLALSRGNLVQDAPAVRHVRPARPGAAPLSRPCASQDPVQPERHQPRHRDRPCSPHPEPRCQRLGGGRRAPRTPWGAGPPLTEACPGTGLRGHGRRPRPLRAKAGGCV